MGIGDESIGRFKINIVDGHWMPGVEPPRKCSYMADVFCNKCGWFPEDERYPLILVPMSARPPEEQVKAAAEFIAGRPGWDQTQMVRKDDVREGAAKAAKAAQDELVSETIARLAELYNAVGSLQDPEGRLAGINPGPELTTIQAAFEEVAKILEKWK